MGTDYDPDLLHRILHSVAYWLGLTSPDSPTYLFWSGFGSSLRDVIVIYTLYRVYKYRREHWWNDPRV